MLYHISIHAPLAGCDSLKNGQKAINAYFNPRTPCGVRLIVSIPPGNDFCISIHAPLAGCDVGANQFAKLTFDFNPRTPCGVRPSKRTY